MTAPVESVTRPVMVAVSICPKTPGTSPRAIPSRTKRQLSRIRPPSFKNLEREPTRKRLCPQSPKKCVNYFKPELPCQADVDNCQGKVESSVFQQSRKFRFWMLVESTHDSLSWP